MRVGDGTPGVCAATPAVEANGAAFRETTDSAAGEVVRVICGETFAVPVTEANDASGFGGSIGDWTPGVCEAAPAVGAAANEGVDETGTAIGETAPWADAPTWVRVTETEKASGTGVDVSTVTGVPTTAREPTIADDIAATGVGFEPPDDSTSMNRSGFWGETDVQIDAAPCPALSVNGPGFQGLTFDTGKAGSTSTIRGTATVIANAADIETAPDIDIAPTVELTSTDTSSTDAGMA